MDEREKKIQIQVAAAFQNMRLDHVVHHSLEAYSRSAVSKWIKEGLVCVNGKVSAKPGTLVQEGDQILATIPIPVSLQKATPQNIPLDILFEDADVMVINKPKGMVVHPAPGHQDDTLVNAVLFHAGDSLSGIGGVLRPGIVHRIDKDTTGAILVCKNDEAHLSLSAQLKAHTIERVYTAIVTGLVKEENGTIDLPLARSLRDRKKMDVAKKPGAGKRAVTHFRVVKRYPKDRLTLVECRLETGRTHQIRVHMTHMGHPLLGDLTYQPRQKSRFGSLQGQCLHAGILAFDHPKTGERIHTEAPLPPYFVSLLDNMQ